MVKRLLLVALLVGCAKREEPQPVKPPPAPAPAPAAAPRADSTGTQVAVPLGEGAGAPPALAFKIVKSWEKQKPSDKPPYHEEGGTWLFFDAEAGDAHFTFGMDDVAPKGDIPVAFAKGQFSVADRESGGKLLAQLASALKQTAPAKGAELPLQPLKLTLAVLGRNMTRLPNGGFQGIGNWTATKAFPQLEGKEGEVFFNFSLGAQKGEFSEKDADYDKDVVAVFATLRDGMPASKKK
jgi:hypothetical protein